MDDTPDTVYSTVTEPGGERKNKWHKVGMTGQKTWSLYSPGKFDDEEDGPWKREV